MVEVPTHGRERERERLDLDLIGRGHIQNSIRSKYHQERGRRWREGHLPNSNWCERRAAPPLLHIIGGGEACPQPRNRTESTSCPAYRFVSRAKQNIPSFLLGSAPATATNEPAAAAPVRSPTGTLSLLPPLPCSSPPYSPSSSSFWSSTNLLSPPVPALTLDRAEAEGEQRHAELHFDPEFADGDAA